MSEEKIQIPNTVQTVYEIQLDDPNKLYIFDVDIGNMPTGKAEEYVKNQDKLIKRATFDHVETFNYIMRAVRRPS